MKENRVCTVLGIKYPIAQGGMTWVSEAVLSAAVSGRTIDKPVRALKNMLTREFHRLEDEGLPWEEIEGLAVGRLRKAVMEGDTTHGSVMMGQVAGLVKQTGSVEEILTAMIAEYDEVVGRMGGLAIPIGGFTPSKKL